MSSEPWRILSGVALGGSWQIRKGGSLFLRRRKRSHDEPLSSHRSETNSSTAPKKVTKILRGELSFYLDFVGVLRLSRGTWVNTA